MIITRSNSNPDSKRKKYGWIIFSSVAIPYILVYFHRVSPAVVSEDLISFFRISGTAFGNLSAVYFYIYTFMQIPAGVLADSIGPKKIIFWGSLVSGAGSVLFGLSAEYHHAFLGRFLVGLGVSVIFVSILKLNQHWFDAKSFSFMSGVTIFLGNVGAFLASYPLAFLKETIGWKHTFITVGILGILSGFLAYFTVTNHPAEKGLPAPEGLQESKPLTLKEAGRGLFRVMKNPYTWFPFFAFFGIYGSLMVLQGSWGVLYLMHVYGMENKEASQNIMFITLGLMAGGILQGNLARRFRIKRLFFFNILLVFLIFVLLGNFLVSREILKFLFLVLGFSVSSFIFAWTLSKNANPPELAGSAIGIANMGGFLGAALLQPLFGFLLDTGPDGNYLASGMYSFFSYRRAFFSLEVSLLFSLIFILLSKEK